MFISLPQTCTCSTASRNITAGANCSALVGRRLAASEGLACGNLWILNDLMMIFL